MIRERKKRMRETRERGTETTREKGKERRPEKGNCGNVNPIQQIFMNLHVLYSEKCL